MNQILLPARAPSFASLSSSFLTTIIVARYEQEWFKELEYALVTTLSAKHFITIMRLGTE